VSTDQRATIDVWRVWRLVMLVIAPLTVLWSLVNPMFASPDEPAHMARAQGFSQLDFSPPYETDGLPMDAPDCFKFNGTVTADCADNSWGVDGTEVSTKTRDYPPLFHAVAAVPAVFTSGLTGAYVMRIWMALVCTSLISFAAALLTGRGRWPLVGLLLGLTPMSVFVASTVNPSGITVAFAALAVAGAIRQWVWRSADRRTTFALVIGLLGLLLVRRDGVMTVGVLLAVFAPYWWSADLSARVRRANWRKGTNAALAVLAASVVIVFVIPIGHRFLTNTEVGGNGSRWQALEVMRIYFDHMVGTFGWIDTFIGPELFTIAAVLAMSMVILGVVAAERRPRMSIIVAFASLFVVPVVFGMFRYPYFQGRYLLPIWLAVAAVSALAVASADIGVVLSRRLSTLLVVGWGVVHAMSFVQNLRRYAVGNAGTWRFAFDSSWHPPTMPNAVAILALVAVLLLAGDASRRLARV
jgi:hypothetical protein